METGDFEMPSPKRQKTESPVYSRLAEVDPSQPSTDVAPDSSTEQNNASIDIPGLTLNSLSDQNSNEPRDVLDVLMQHVESETATEMEVVERKEVTEKPQVLPDIDPPRTQETLSEPVNQNPIDDIFEPSESVDMPSNIELQPEDRNISQIGAKAHPMTLDPSEPPQQTEQATTQNLNAVAEVGGLPAPPDNIQLETQPPATSDPSGQSREWETDSSPYESSSTDTDSSDSSDDSSDDSEGGDEYTLLDPYEQARILMAENGGGGSDDEEDGHSVNRASRPGGGAGIRTTNEKAEDILPKPSIIITEDMHTEELGTVEAIVENTLLIRAKISGEYQVLESGSVLCLADRSVVGAVAETLGRVEQPLYTVRFASRTDIEEAGLHERGTKIYYVREHSTFVFTQPLQGVKGSDASNFHDEEVGDDEMEFSDDEAEAEHKRQMKLRRKGIDPDSMPAGGRGRGRGGRGRANGPRGGYSSSHRGPSFDTDSGAYANSSNEVAMNYDDVEQGETSYTPLKRPETMTAAGAMSPPPSNYPSSSFSRPQNSSQSGSSRGGYERHQHRGRGRGNFNSNRGRGRGSYNAYSGSSNNSNVPAISPYDQTHSSAAQNPFQYSPTAGSYNNQHSPGFTFQPPPPPPALTPTNQNTFPGNAFSPSPITPLPGSSFNFPAFPNFNMNMNMSQWPQAPQSPQQPAHGGYNNAEAIAQVQRQLEELRRYGANGTQQ